MREREQDRERAGYREKEGERERETDLAGDHALPLPAKTLERPRRICTHQPVRGREIGREGG